MRTSRGYLALYLTILIWGSTFLVTKVVLGQIGPLQLTGLRFLIAFVGMAPLAVRQGFRWNDVFQARFVAFGLTGTTLYYALQNVGMTLTSVSSTVLILSSVPALTAVLAVIFLKERLDRNQILGIGLVTVGVGLIALGSGNIEEGSGVLVGNLMIFGSALSWAVYTIQGRKMAGDRPALVMTAASTAAGALMLLPFVGWEITRIGLPHLSVGGWLGIFYLGLAASGLTMFLWNYALQTLPASVASAYVNLVPVIGMAGAFMLGETPPLVQLAGGVLALVGVWLSSRSASHQVN